jgi:hypothetical protein
MDHDENNPADSLLEWHLNSQGDGDRSRIEAELHRDEELQAKSNRLGRILRPLDHWTVSSGSADLAERVLRVVEQSATSGADAAFAPVAEPADSGIIRFPFLRLRDLAAAAACIILLLGVSIPGVSALRSRSQRTFCANNLSGIFQGVGAYQAAYAGALPFAGFAQNAAWLPDRNDRSPYTSNSRHVYLLLKHRFVAKPQIFLCPCAEDAEPMNAADTANNDDFAGARNICYDSLNLAGPSPNIRPAATIAYLGDANPLFVGARFNEGLDPQIANSPAHGGRGQTILILDGHAEYLRSPIYGSHKDNVWVIEGVRRYTGNEVTARPDDAFLVPGFPRGDRPSAALPTH